MALPTLLESASLYDQAAWDALGGMGSNATSVLPLRRRQVIEHRDPHFRLTAAVTAWRIAPKTEPLPLAQLTNALGATTNTFQDYRSAAQLNGLRYQVTHLLGLLGPAGRDAIPALEAARRHPNFMLREMVEEALERISQ